MKVELHYDPGVRGFPWTATTEEYTSAHSFSAELALKDLQRTIEDGEARKRMNEADDAMMKELT